jgi:hypothetical protein
MKSSGKRSCGDIAAIRAFGQLSGCVDVAVGASLTQEIPENGNAHANLCENIRSRAHVVIAIALE